MKSSEPSYSSAGQADISRLVNQVLYKLHPEIEQNRVKVDTDVMELVADVDSETIEAAIKNLVKHALNLMPQGGEMSVTLIDGNYQWELEVADSSTALSSSNRFSPLAGSDDSDSLPEAIPYVIDEFLVDAHRLALRHGGQIQTWDCPQGGMANVLVIPKRSSIGDSVRRSA